MNKHLHIVSFAEPYPPEYGGVIDVFFKLKYLHRAGLEITLHCFTKKKEKHAELEKYCMAVYYYPRKNAASITLPYIVYSRRNKLLLQRLQQADGPILLEGIHTTYYLYDGDLKNKNVWVRLHNVEYIYYRRLFETSRQWLKKIYYLVESALLRKYEKKLAPGNQFIAISHEDAQVYEKMLAQAVHCIPLFSGFEKVESLTGTGSYCLYHGNLSVPENEQAATFLIEKVFPFLEIPLKVCGREPTRRLIQLCQKNQVELIIHPCAERLRQLIMNAHINVLPSFNSTGMKAKILNALTYGRFVVTHSNAAIREEWSTLCTIAHNANDVIQAVQQMEKMTFTESMKQSREERMKQWFHPEQNAIQIIELLFNPSTQRHYQ